MFMENFVMTTTLTIEELDSTVTETATFCCDLCLPFIVLDVEELDQTPFAAAEGPCCWLVCREDRQVIE